MCKAPDIFGWILYERRHQYIDIIAGFMKQRDLATPHAIIDKMATR
jgi:hypothetical protein